ncbi:MAG: peptidoglycan-binding domain-containing protein [Aulosira sp. ZfuVER01]|nr:peptidoglycan-binding domain-containing protein [Aulosira sp. ZfuVER01]MDZ7998601.1 peptidoglycan-binding domain-containing protein [Aulosira sp. DedVER01a]MDZ8052054.1 peptidoglycan-binding domain-containing protein [Aulosira sp. ZfuCHP01]
MSEIGLLMTGVLTTGQPSLPDLPEQQPLYLENSEQNFIQGQLSHLVPTAQITPPEFMETDGTPLASPLSIDSNQENQERSPHSGSLIAKNLIAKARVQNDNSSTLPTIRFGSSGVIVRVLQRLLVSHGYGIRIDGAFGPLTEAAVKAFQNRHNIAVDGIVGQRTWRELTI